MLGRRRRGDHSGRPPAWSTPRTHPRVLVEHPDGAVRDHLVTGLRDRGYDTLGCGGPDAEQPCPLLVGLPCPAVDSADAIVTGLTHRPEGRSIAALTHALAPARPVVVEGTPLMTHDLDRRLPVVPAHPLDVDHVADALDARLARR